MWHGLGCGVAPADTISRVEDTALARKLVFRFKDKMFDRDEALEWFSEEAPLSILSRALEIEPLTSEKHNLLLKEMKEME